MADESERLTYGDLERRSVRLARLLRSAGLKDGDRVAILMENRLDWIVAMWAARRATLLFVPVNWHLKAEEVRYVVDNSDARSVITSAALLDLAAEATRDMPAVQLRLTVGPAGHGFQSLDDATEGLSDTPLDDERDGAAMPYSSGTSGKPKGILRALDGAPFATPSRLETMLASLYGMDANAVYMSPAPIYHSAPVSFTQAALVHGGAVVVMERFVPQATLDAIARWGVTVAQFVPTHFVRMLKLPEGARRATDLSSLRVVVHAAAPCAPQVKRRMIDWLGSIVLEYYSGNERCGFTDIDTADWLAHLGSIGRSRTGPIHIVDPDTGEEITDGGSGLIYFENPVPFDTTSSPTRRRKRSPRKAGERMAISAGWTPAATSI